MFGYNSSLGIYRCPADRSTLTNEYAGLGDPSGNSGQWPRARSYNMSMSVNGFPDFDPFVFANVPMFKKLCEIKAPNADKCLVFIDEREYTMVDSQFGMPTATFLGGSDFTWWDSPANRHNQAANFSFADGHVDRWHWKVPKIVTISRGQQQAVLSDEWDDYNRMEAGFKQDF